MQNINKKNKFTFIRNFFSISPLVILNLFGFTQYSSAQTFVFDGTNIGTTLTEGIIDTNNTAINQTSFGKTQVYFGGDTPDIQSDNGGVVASSILTNQSYDLTAIGALKISGTFYNRDANASYNESYVGIVPNGITTLANPANGYPVDDREGMNLAGGGTSQNTIPTAKWFTISATIGIRGTDLVLLEKVIDGVVSGPTVLGPVSDYPYLNDLRTFIAVDDSASQMDVEILSANLVTTITTSSSIASVGDTVIYTITVTNNGSEDATNVSLIDSVSGSIENLVADASQGSFSNDGTWIVGNLANGESATLNLTGTVSDGVQGGVITNSTTAAATSDLADPTTDGDVLTADISIDPIVPLQGECSGAFDWDNSGWELGQKVGTIMLMDGLTADINVSTTSAGTFSMNSLDTPFIDSKTYYFGGVSDLGIIFEPDANTSTSPVTIKLTFSEPVYNGSFLVSDIDTSTNGTSDRDDQVTVTSDLGTPTLQVVHSSAPLVSVNANVATTTYNDVNGSQNDTRGTVRVVIPDGATSVTLTYEEVDTTVEDHGARGIGTFGNLAVCKAEVDSDGDGIADKDDLDDDNDGVLDSIEGNSTIDTDGDGIPNYLDLDSDNDGIPDNVEAQTTSSYKVPTGSVDANGTWSAVYGANGLIPVDTDEDNVTDMLDTDSDNDSITDCLEDNDALSTCPVTTAMVGTNGLAAWAENADDYIDVNGKAYESNVFMLDDSDNDTLADGSDANGVVNNLDYRDNATTTNSSEDNVTAETGKAVTIDVLANDTDAEDDMDPTTVKIVDADGNRVTTLTVPNEGTWTVNATTGAITFTPEAGFTGDPTPITYVVSDKAGNESAPATVNVDYPEVELDSDHDGVVDSIDLDDDNDGIPDIVEEHGTPDLDTDTDGVPDRLDLDSDNDGILDLLESGQDPSVVDTDGNGVLDSEVDADKDGLRDTADSDDDDKTSLGKVTPIDTDGDHKPDFQDVDSDNDSLSDMVEAGIPAENDEDDSDGMIDEPAVDVYGVPTVVTSVKNPLNTDGDTVPNYRDLDSDNDGLNDVTEVDGLDENRDGIVDTEGSLVNGTSIPDADGDNTPDVLEPSNPNLPTTLDENGDGVIDEDNDNDNDGIPDITDANDNLFGTGVGIDSDGDGIVDDIDIDDDNDGIPDVVENRGNPTRDTDGDGIIDSLDLDSDNDSILDIVEAGGIDAHNDGRVDPSTSSGQVTDTDKDGLADIVDAAPAVANNPADEKAGRLVSLLLIPDTDGDKKPDFQDVDSDNDGLSDLVEAGITVNNDENNDENNDGMIDTPAVNKNGIATVVTAVAHPLDSDNDKIPNYRELDSDNDGKKDIDEAGGADANNDGLVDNAGTLIDVSNLPDVDGNGIPDYRELNGRVEPDLTPEPIDPEPTTEPVEPEPTPVQTSTPEIKPDKKVVDLTEPVTVNVLENDEGELDSASVQIELPDGFMEENPNAVLSDDGKSLIVPGEGTWTVNSDGTITYRAEADTSPVNPTPISYSVANTDGKRLETDTTIVLSQSVVAAGTNTVESCDCVSVEDNVSIYKGWSLGLVALLGSIFGLFFFRREKN